MLSILTSALGKVLLSIAVKLVAEDALEDLLIFGLAKLAGSTKTAVDDELLALVKKHLEKE
jgi:hypothetical protein